MSARRCLVLGGSGTLGRVVCETLAAQGASVVFTYCSDESSARALSDALPGSRTLRLDATLPGETSRVVREAVESMGGIDALVHCAAIGTTRAATFELLEDIDDAGWERMIAVNTTSAFIACRELARIGATRDANIVLTGSIDCAKPMPSSVHYAASKSALTGLSHALAKALGPRNIRVNVVAPGVLESGLSSVLPADLTREYVKHCALQRKGRLGEIAGLIAWLALENTYVNGRTLLVDGGV